MSGCCGQGPVIVSSAAVPTARVDVEPLLLCDVLPDGTVAGVAQVESIYDANTGARLSTRIVNPTTGATYTPTGTLTVCQPPADCARQVTQVTRCDDTTGDGVGDTEYVEVWSLDPCDGGAPQLVGTYLAGDFTSSYTPTSAAPCPVDAPDTPVVLGTVCYTASGGGTSTAAVLKCQACADPAVTYVDLATGAVLTAPTIVPCPVAADRSAQLLCDVQANGTSTPFLRTFATDDTGTTHTDTQLDGTTAYTPTGTVGACLPVSDCASPTTPTATIGLCLPDGTPIAVTVVRDCNGTVTSEGWINLQTGAYSAGAPPVGTVACGNSQSVQVSGTFCDVLADGTVAGLVLIEYSYAADGTIASVRLVDATTGATYTPTGTVTTCPVGVEQPEQDVVQLCDTAADGTVTQMVRDYRRDETGAIVGHSDYLLDGSPYTPTGTVGDCQPVPQPERDLTVLCDVQADGSVTTFLRDYQRDVAGTVTGHADYVLNGSAPYTPTGTVGVCQPKPCKDCETLVLCDLPTGAPVTISGTAASGTLSNGVGWTSTGATNNTAMAANLSNTDGSWWGLHSFPHSVTAPTKWTFSRPSTVEFSVYVRYFAPDPTISHAQLPPGLDVVSLPDGYTYDETTGVLTRTSDAAPIDPCSYVTDPRIASSARFRTAGPVTTFTTAPAANSRIASCGTFFTYWAGAVSVVPGGPFLRQICRSCDGTATVTDTLLDGITPYTVAGTAGVCDSSEPRQCDTTVMGECVYSLPDTMTGFDTANTGFPDCWLGTATNPTYTFGDRVTSWEGTYQSSTGTPSDMGFTSPDLGGAISFAAFTPAMPASPTPTPPPYVGTATFNGVTVTLRVLAGDGVINQGTQVAVSPGDRFRIEFSTPVRLAVTTTNFADPPTPHMERLCGVVAETVPWTALKLADCEGAITTVDADTRAPLPANATVTCDDDCCQPVQVCIQQDTTQSVEFISNEGHLNDNSVDPVWKWTPNLSVANPPWYDMYEFQYSTAWSVVDSDTARPAWWVSPHPSGASAQSSPARPNEGPSLLNAHWFPRAFFDLPDNADPATIKIQATVLNADQIGRAFRLNGGAWQSLPATATHNGTTYTFGPATIPGAQAGRNFLYLDVEETVGGGSGLMVHLKVTYEVIPETRSWTRMICCDGTIYYLDEDGARQDAIPEGWHLAPCGGEAGSSKSCAKQVVERCGCDDTTGDGVGDVQYTELWAVDPCNGAAPTLLGTFLDGDLTQPYTPAAPVDCTAAELLPRPLSTGVRAVTGTAAQNIASSFPGVQSVSLTVLAGAVNVTMSDGAAVPVPAGVTMTWSVAQDSDTALAAASFAGATAAASYLLNWTYR
ncbi:hypothetical protein [Streptomyces griseofuscus]|uniref:Uncharacterized protein n=1 Tax=Streptomyces griseofuscus TaxID=146922 RepID=A0A7H1Q3R1_9ACTN|nr:hypothetical protein [Streptomyces griseofuscus]QNT94941.1 hypothetical protein HEP81_04669 [Streptomyces griseofuscus]